MVDGRPHQPWFWGDGASGAVTRCLPWARPCVRELPTWGLHMKKTTASRSPNRRSTRVRRGIGLLSAVVLGLAGGLVASQPAVAADGPFTIGPANAAVVDSGA